MYSQSGAEELVFWTFEELIIFFSDTAQSRQLHCAEELVSSYVVVVVETNIIKSFVASSWIIREYFVVYEQKVGVIKLVRNSCPTHTDLFYRLHKRGKELFLSYF